jgi:hypothetical protein
VVATEAGDHQRMGATYAVSWQDPAGALGSGRLELGAEALLLEGRNGSSAVTLAFPYEQMSDCRVARSAGERLHARKTLVIDLAGGGTLRVAGIAQFGIVSELASRLSSLRH